MMNHPRVSVVMATHNGAQYIAEAIQSVLNQTFSDFELIVIDDGSTDNTSEIVSQFLFDNRIKYFYQKNKGTSAARNKGIEEAKGIYIAFIDQDDIYFPEKIYKTYQYLEKNAVYGMVYTNMHLIDSQGQFICEWLTKMKFYGEGDIYLNLLSECFFGPIAILVRKSVLFDAGLFNEDVKCVEDIDLWLRIARISKIGLIREPLVKWRQHDNNFSKNLRVAVPNLINVFERQLLLNLSSNERVVVRHEMSRLYFELSLMRLGEGLLRQGQGMLKKSMLYGFRFRAVLIYISLSVRFFDPYLYKHYYGRY